MNEKQIQELLESYDRMRELMVRVNANMTHVNTVFSGIREKEMALEEKLLLLEKKVDQSLEAKMAALEKRASETGKKPDSINSATASSMTVGVRNSPVVASSTSRQRTSPVSITLKDYFVSKGLEVIDKRPSGGNLWVTGDITKLRKAVDDAKTIYGITGSYGSGRATKHRDGWFTKSSK